MGLVADPLAHQADEVLGVVGALEAHQVGAEQALEELAAPRQLLEQLGRGNGMCRKNPIRRSGRRSRSIAGTSWSW